MRTLAISRKNRLFVVSPFAGERAAILFSLIASCKVNLVEPWKYLSDVFTRLPQWPNAEQMHQLLPTAGSTPTPRIA